MSSCCEDKGCEIAAMRQSHGKVLWTVLAINATMFFVEAIGGWIAHSTSLLADALDMFGDALVYGFSLMVLARSERWQAKAALIKGAFMLVFGMAVLAEAGYKIWHPTTLGVETMGLIGFLALMANLSCFFMLYRHRGDNLNMSSTWLCSRNDLIANVGVLLAAAGSYGLASYWPDVIVGLLIAALFLGSAMSVLRQSVAALAAPSHSEPPASFHVTSISRPRKMRGNS
jgi:cation diffusion facilitator family transporter